MAIVRPFRGIRYDLEKIGTDLSALACPPYDLIPPARQKQLYQRHPNNFVRIDLNQPQEGDSQGAHHDRSAEIWKRWLAEGVLRQDDTPCFYLYRQTFTATVGGVDDRYSRTGLIASVHSDDSVLPHECTSDSLADDRYQLAKRLDAFVGQAFLLYTDPSRTVEKTTETLLQGKPWSRMLDDDSVEHCLFVVDDPWMIGLIEKTLSDKNCLIADGHHRWEGGKRLWAERDPDGSHHHGMLATLVNTEAPGLVALPIHRLYRRIESFDALALRRKLETRFTVEEFPYAGVDAAEALLASANDADHAFVIRWKDADSILLAHAPRGAFGRFGGLSRERSELDLEVLRRVVQEELLGIDDTQAMSILDGHLVMDYLDGTEAQFAILSNPTPVEAIEAVALRGELLPQKSTLFRPLPWSGMVSLPLSG